LFDVRHAPIATPSASQRNDAMCQQQTFGRFLQQP
jgi:hypothetical protein